MVTNDVANVAPGDELVRDEVQPVVFADVKDAGDIVVIEAGRSPRFVEESLNRTCVATATATRP